MAITAWHKNVQRKNALTYSTGASFKAGHWATALDKAITEFNHLMSRHGLTLALKKVEQGMGPHIVFETEPGHGTHGSAPSQTKRINGSLYLDLVTIRVPATPRIDPSDPTSREVGAAVRVCILVHEMIHAVGLSNDEHSPDDVFAAKSVVLAKGTYLRSKAQAADDMVQPPDGSDPLPPIRIGAKTLTDLKKAWPGEGQSPR